MNLTERRTQLENLGVHDLRNIGRMWGVPSPTLMKKEQLIDAIVQVMSGEKTFAIKSRAGRPVKNKLMGRFQEGLLPKELINFAERRNKDSILSDRFLPFANGEESDFSGGVGCKSGYLVKHNQYYYFCAQDDVVVHVPDVLVAQFGLVIGDYIKAIISSASKKNYYLARDIEEINHKSSLTFVRKLSPIKGVILSNKEIVNNIKEGSKTHISKNSLDFIKENTTFFNEITERGYKLMIVAVSLPADGLLKIDKFVGDCTSFLSYFENEPLYSYEAINNAINHATVIARSGEKVFMIVLNVENIYTELDLYFLAKGECRDTPHAYSTIKTLRKLMGLNRVLANGGSITIYSTTSDKEFKDMVS